MRHPEILKAASAMLSVHHPLRHSQLQRPEHPSTTLKKMRAGFYPAPVDHSIWFTLRFLVLLVRSLVKDLGKL
jgi:hypothetical protein